MNNAIAACSNREGNKPCEIASEERDKWRLQERRKEARYTLILRAGVLEQAGKSSLCLVKNISTSGVQVKVYARPTPDAEVSIRIADEPLVRGRLMWLKDDIAGIAFHQDLDATTLLRVQQKLRSKRRRAMQGFLLKRWPLCEREVARIVRLFATSPASEPEFAQALN